MARIDRKLLAGLGQDETYRMVRVPVTASKSSTRKRYCGSTGISMGRAIVTLIDTTTADKQVPEIKIRGTMRAMPVSDSWAQRFLVWAVLIWITVAIGGGVAGAAWGLAGFDCDGGPGRLQFDGPCPIASDPTISQLSSHVVSGAIRLGLAAAALGYVPGLVFAVSASVLGWVLNRAGVTRSVHWAPWMTLGVGVTWSVVWLVRSEMVSALWAWGGLIVAVSLAAIGIERADRPRSESVAKDPIQPSPPRSPDIAQ